MGHNPENKVAFKGPLVTGSVSQTTTNPPVSGKIRNQGVVLNTQVSQLISFNSGNNFDTGIVIPLWSLITNISFIVVGAFTNSNTTSITLGGYTQNENLDRPVYVPIGTGLAAALAVSATELGPINFKQVAVDSFYQNNTSDFYVGNGDSKIYASITANSATAGIGKVQVSYLQGYYAYPLNGVDPFQ
jgi:hypothetical protein|tara:strand:+ start:45 stop:608 length:564 start_codon:yes stop_codon:yes gene_type:complete